jgi:hypothetical protein
VISSRDDVGGLGSDADVDDVGINTNAIVDLWAISSFASSSFFYIFHQLIHIAVTVAVATVLNPRQDARPNAPQPARNDRLLLLGAALDVPDMCAADAAARAIGIGIGIGIGMRVRVRQSAAVFAGAARRAARVGCAGCAAHEPFGVLDEFVG